MDKKLKFFGADLESTGLLHHLAEQGDKARLHNFAMKSTASGKHMILHPMEEAQREKLQNILDRDDVVMVIHNGIGYDLEALKFFGFDVSKVKVLDTLMLAWYVDFFKENPRFGLEQYGVELGFPKPPIENWEDLTQEEYDNRVFGDINIQTKLWNKLCHQFAELYNIPQDDMMETNVYNHHCMKYLMWKGEQLRQQQENKWKFDVRTAQPLLGKIEGLVEEKIEMLSTVMPKVPVYKTKKRPQKMFKGNGDLSALGEKWQDFCNEHGQSVNSVDEIRYIASHNDPNPASPQQIKDWLYSLGWEPETFDYKKDDSGERKIPQIYIKGSGGKVCPSVERLAEEVPEVEHLVGLGVLKHRKAMIAGWLGCHKNGFLEARAQGFTNTLRLKHAELVNLPSSRVMLGSEVRGLLTVRHPDNVLLGSDLSSLENRLKFHFQMPLDPDYVKAQMSDDFDPHLAIAVMAGLLTEDEANFYKVVNGGFDRGRYQTTVLDTMLAWDEGIQESEIKRIVKVRGIGKGGNYSCLPMDYLVGTPEGVKHFSDISVGDTVWGSDEFGVRVPVVIEALHHYPDAETVGINMNGIEVWSTLNHRWKADPVYGDFYVNTYDLLNLISEGEYMHLCLNLGSEGDVYEGRSTLQFVEIGRKDQEVFCLTTTSGNFEMVTPCGATMLTGNCQYGAGAKTVARTTKTSLEVGKMIVDGYRELNWSIDVIANNTSIKKTSFGDFQLNPLNKMYYPLKTAKDRFSTLIQGSGSYVLDLWLMFITKRINQADKVGRFQFRPMLIATWHDECVYECHKLDEDFMRQLVKDSIGDVNKAMKLNVDLDCDIQFGQNYSDIH